MSYSLKSNLPQLPNILALPLDSGLYNGGGLGLGCYSLPVYPHPIAPYYRLTLLSHLDTIHP
jgi:hypothetical protein